MTDQRITDDYVAVCPLAEIADLSARAVQVDGESVCLARVGDDVFAVRNVCTHAEVALSEGTVGADATVSCWLHGSRFDLRTGEPDEPPAWEPVATYSTRITDQSGVPTIEVSRRSNQETPA